MTNKEISKQFSLLADLMDIHGEDEFRSKRYSIAAYHIDRLDVNLTEIEPDKLAVIKGIGDSNAKRITEILQTGTMSQLQEYIGKTPLGVIDMLNIKGLGPKKIQTVWKVLEIENLGELLYACNENRLTLYKGFGEKTQTKIKEGIEFFMNHQGSYLYAQIEDYALKLDDVLKKEFNNYKIELTGAFKRNELTISKLEWVTTADKPVISKYFTDKDYTVFNDDESYISFKHQDENIEIGFHLSNDEKFVQHSFETTAAEIFIQKWNENFPEWKTKNYLNDKSIFIDNNVQVIPAYARETEDSIAFAKENKLPQVLQTEDVKGIIHNHSKWSDGNQTIEQMAVAAQKSGFEYLVISDHSKTANYVKGLEVERVIAQQQEIDELNEKVQDFRIYKSIESDILGDGSLDYDDDILQTFDLVIASVHSNLNMNEDKAMARLITVIENPYTNILGHCTGRLLLSRNGYPIDHKKIIDACAANNVALELNANPRRLDVDWRWIQYAVSKNVLISINPDAHDISSFSHIRYGVLAAQKGLLTKEQNLSSFSRAAFEEWLVEQHRKRG